MPPHITTPLIMSFSVEENAVFIHEFSKKSPYRGGDNPLACSAPSHITAPLRLNPGYATGGGGGA